MSSTEGAVLDRSDPLNSLFALAIIEVTEKEETVTDANDLMCELAGYPPGFLNGMSLDMLIPERSRVAHHHYSAGYAARPEARPMGPDREVVLLHSNGSEIRVWVGLAPRGQNLVTAAVMPMDIGRSFGLPRHS